MNDYPLVRQIFGPARVSKVPGEAPLIISLYDRRHPVELLFDEAMRPLYTHALVQARFLAICCKMRLNCPHDYIGRYPDAWRNLYAVAGYGPVCDRCLFTWATESYPRSANRVPL